MTFAAITTLPKPLIIFPHSNYSVKLSLSPHKSSHGTFLDSLTVDLFKIPDVNQRLERRHTAPALHTSPPPYTNSANPNCSIKRKGALAMTTATATRTSIKAIGLLSKTTAKVLQRARIHIIVLLNYLPIQPKQCLLGSTSGSCEMSKQALIFNYIFRDTIKSLHCVKCFRSSFIVLRQKSPTVF